MRPLKSKNTMVSKILRRNSTKPKSKPSPSGFRHHYRRLKDSPLKTLVAAPALLVASFDKSIHTCRRRLFKIFDRFTNISGTPKSSKNEHLVYLRNRATLSIRKMPNFNIPLLPPTERRTVFLDLDETLIHSFVGPSPPEKYDFVVNPTIDCLTLRCYVLKRPSVDGFLTAISRYFELVVFTAGVEEYASLVLDQLDPNGELFAHRLYRNSCRKVDDKVVKDLSATGRRLDRAVIVDDNPQAYLLQPKNVVPVTPFMGNLDDRELHRVMELFKTIAVSKEKDMREAVKLHLTDGT